MSTWHAPPDDPRRWRLWPRWPDHRDPGVLARLVRICLVEREEPVYVFETVAETAAQAKGFSATFYVSEGAFVPEGGGG